MRLCKETLFRKELKNFNVVIKIDVSKDGSRKILYSIEVPGFFDLTFNLFQTVAFAAIQFRSYCCHAPLTTVKLMNKNYYMCSNCDSRVHVKEQDLSLKIEENKISGIRGGYEALLDKVIYPDDVFGDIILFQEIEDFIVWVFNEAHYHHKMNSLWLDWVKDSASHEKTYENELYFSNLIIESIEGYSM